MKIVKDLKAEVKVDSWTEDKKVMERDFCPRCIHYIDKQYI